jgi:Domain of unknown function (DUF4145)
MNASRASDGCGPPTTPRTRDASPTQTRRRSNLFSRLGRWHQSRCHREECIDEAISRLCTHYANPPPRRRTTRNAARFSETNSSTPKPKLRRPLMNQIILDCPHCRARNAAFSPNGGYGRQNHAFALARCSVCNGGIVAKLLHNEDACQWIYNDDPPRSPVVLEIWPKPMVEGCPASPPHNVSRPYLQGAANLRYGHFDAAGAMFRKCLETALKQLDPTGKGSPAKRIDELPRDSGVTPEMRRWAHAIRILGNEAVHEEDSIDESEASDLQHFANLFLIYAFTLPAMVSRRFTKEAAA